MSDRMKLLSHPIPLQGCRGGHLRSGRVVGPGSSLACLPPQCWDLLLLPLGVVRQYSGPPCTYREVSCHLHGTWMWERLNPALFVHPSLSSFFVLAGLVLLGFSPRDLLNFSEKPVSVSRDS